MSKNNYTPKKGKKTGAIVLKGNRNALPELWQSESDRIKPLTAELTEMVATGLQKGLSPEDACAVALISPHLYHEWSTAGKSLLEGKSSKFIPDLLPLQPGEDKEEYDSRKSLWVEECNMYVDFFLMCNQAKQELNQNMLGIITEYANNDNFDSWRAAKEVLKMRAGAEYAESTKTEHEHKINAEVKHTHESPQIQTLMANIARSIGTALPEAEDNVIEGEVVDVQPTE